MIRNVKIKSGAVFFTLLLIGSFISIPVMGIITSDKNSIQEYQEKMNVLESFTSWDYPQDHEISNQLDVPYKNII